MKQGRRGLVRVLSLICITLGAPPHVWGAPRAWLISGDGEATKLDLAQQVIVGTDTLPVDRFSMDDMSLDASRGNLFVPYGRTAPLRVGVVDLKTLTLKGHLDFTVDEPPPTTGNERMVAFVFPPTGGELSVRWWNPAAAAGAGAFEVATVDARTFRKTAGQVTSPPLADRLLLDGGGRQVYSITIDRPARIDVFDVPSFTLRSTIDLETFINPSAFGRDIPDFGNNRILLGENEKTVRTDPNRDTFFVFDVASSRITPKIRTGLSGNAKLLPRTNRVLFDEVSVLTPGAVMARSGRDFVHLGRIHVYDIATGNRLGTVAVADVETGQILGVSAAEDTVYYLSQGVASPAPKLSIISLATFSVVKELGPVEGDVRMFFFDE